ncbi:5'-methylthioadenosine/S-adenosylhomocysteine nucleosidase [Streptomyces cinnabarinus]|uniref:5'-methylthioadenosine/S-adenosylhomocysteine nucleosidase n=1 Tax=Streptomyces cinnabarinus TaxID=67287 RepID=A0ABY7KQW8_9ACTN|nr:5'-methylthioadenosine/S-adenosylhomocysteine nucleosidase [Streptomyces cinnabarinus]WAZ25264.1 5'-methylthioadenosine/S-adenosylhomocysteine nucleosidase [Streptomyces cinnabarinus]
MPDIPRPIVAILTALPLEYEAVRTRLGELETLVHPQGTRAKVGRLDGTPWHVALVRTGEKSLNAAVLTERVINWLQPQAVIFVGVAGSLKKDVAIGDVVVATKVVAYQGGKQTKEGFHVRPDAWHASHALEGAAFDALGTKAHYKPIAAGDVVLDDDASALAKHIKHHYNDAVAIEMEANGISHAAELSRRVDALVIRGISDLANGLKSEADASGSQVRAAANAAEAALATVREMVPAPQATASAPPAPTPAEAPAQYAGDHHDHRYGVYHAPVIGKVVYNNPPRPNRG